MSERRLDPIFLHLAYMRAFGRLTGQGSRPTDLLKIEHYANKSGESIVGKHASYTGTLASAIECIYWATTLDEHLRAVWPHESNWYDDVVGGELMRGVRFARNRVHHQWANAIGVIDDEKDVPEDLAHVNIRWLSPLPAGRPDKEGEATYRDRLAGERVLDALGTLLVAFANSLVVLKEHGLSSGGILAPESS